MVEPGTRGRLSSRISQPSTSRTQAVKSRPLHKTKTWAPNEAMTRSSLWEVMKETITNREAETTDKEVKDRVNSPPFPICLRSSLRGCL